MEKRIIQHSKLEEIKDPNVHKAWGRHPDFMFYYYGRQVAKVGFVGSELNVQVYTVFAPWAYISNDKGQYFANVNRVEDQIHGTNLIDVSNLQALFMEYTINNQPPVDKAQEFADLLTLEMEQANKSMKLAGIGINTLSHYKNMITGISHSTFPMWNSKGQKK